MDHPLRSADVVAMACLGKPSQRCQARNGQILLLTGQQVVERAVRSIFQGQSYDLRRAPTAACAEDLMRTCQPDIVITDLEAPDLAGQDLLRRLRGISNAGIIVVASAHDATGCDRVLMAGADDYVSHPVRATELLARVHALLRRISASVGAIEAETIEAGDVRINLQTREVIVAGQRPHLRPTEFNLLAYLVRRPMTVHPHRELLAAIWGKGMQLRSHYLRMCVAHLRKQVELNAARPRYIVTERGIGYSLRPSGGRRVA